MKPWEETWHWNESAKQVETQYPDTEEYRRVGLVGKTDRVIVETDSGVYPPRDGEIPLIVAAPRMARVLLRLGYGNGTCVYCKRDGDTDPCNTLATGHHAGCIIGDALEAAGVGDWPADFRPSGTS